MSGKRYSAKHMALAAALYLEKGLSIVDVSRVIGCSDNTIRAWFKDMGVLARGRADWKTIGYQGRVRLAAKELRALRREVGAFLSVPNRIPATRSYSRTTREAS